MVQTAAIFRSADRGWRRSRRAPKPSFGGQHDSGRLYHGDCRSWCSSVRSHRPSCGRRRRRPGKTAGGGRAPDRPAVADQVDVQLRRRLGHVRIRQLALQQPQGTRRRREPERSVVRGLRQAGALGDLHDRVVERDLRQGQRRRRADLRLGAGGVRHGRLVVRSRGPLTSAGDRESRCRSARTRSTSPSDGPSTSSDTASCSGTARPRAAAAAATGPTRARRSSLPQSAASSRARTRSRRSISTRTSSTRATAAAACGALNYEFGLGENDDDARRHLHEVVRPTPTCNRAATG